MGIWIIKSPSPLLVSRVRIPGDVINLGQPCSCWTPLQINTSIHTKKRLNFISLSMLILVSIYLNCSISMINSLPNSSFGAIKKNIKKQIETWKNSVKTENKYFCILLPMFSTQGSHSPCLHIMSRVDISILTRISSMLSSGVGLVYCYSDCLVLQYILLVLQEYNIWQQEPTIYIFLQSLM